MNKMDDMADSFESFLKKFASGKDNSQFENNVLSNLSEIRDNVIGIRKILSSVKPSSTADRVDSNIKELENLSQESINVKPQNLSSDIKDLLNSIKVNNTDRLQLEDKDNRDNFTSSDEKLADNSKHEIDLEKKQFEVSKEQLSVMKEIRDTLKPKVPADLEEQKAKRIDISDGIGVDIPKLSLPDMMRRPNISINTGDKKDKPNAKVDPKDKDSKDIKDSKGKYKSWGVGKIGVGALGVAGAAYGIYEGVKGLNKDADLFAIQEKLKKGEITPEQAEEAKNTIIKEHKDKLIDLGAEHGGALAGGIAGASLGAKVGAFAGPVGAFAGSIVGGAVGSFAGRELGQKASNYIKDNKLVDAAKEKADVAIQSLSSAYDDVKKIIQTNIFDQSGKAVDNVVSTVKEKFNVDSIKDKLKSGVESMKNIIEPDKDSQMAKFIGEQPGKFIDTVTKQQEALKTGIADKVGEAKTMVNNIVNNQSSNNYIPLKSTPRAEYTGSALDRYTDKISRF